MNTFCGKNIPMWYGLRVEGVDLFIDIHKQAFDFLVGFIKGNSPIIPYLQKNLQIPSFILPTQKFWGFGRVLRRVESKNEKEVSLQCKIPRSKKLWERAYSVSASLQVLFSVLDIFHYENKTDSKFFQLVAIDAMVTERKDWGGAINISVSPALCRWLNRQEDGLHSAEIAEVMRVVHERMMGKKFSKFFRFTAWFRQPCWVNLECPGNACGLDPEGYENSYMDEGYSLYPHNTDSPVQQLALLAGIADICRRAREDGF